VVIDQNIAEGEMKPESDVFDVFNLQSASYNLQIITMDTPLAAATRSVSACAA
jgi:hypothetical protein